MLYIFYISKGFARILFTPDEAAQVISACEERLLKLKTIDAPFTVEQIQSSILKEHLIDADYAAPTQVTLILASRKQVAKPIYTKGIFDLDT